MKLLHTTSSYTDGQGIVRCGDCDWKIEDCYCAEAVDALTGLGDEARSTGATGADVEEVFV